MALSREEDNLNRSLLPILKSVYSKCVTLGDPHDRRAILRDTLEEFRSFCSERDPIFECLFSEYYYTGSAFEGLQVKEVDEFDVDLVLKFPPCFHNSLHFSEWTSPQSFATLRLVGSLLSVLWSHPRLRPILDFFDDEGYVMPERILSWCQSLIDQFLSSPRRHVRGVVEVSPTSSGPARTLEIRLKNDSIEWISVDLVPVISVTCGTLSHATYLPSGIVPRKLMEKCYLVPKPIKNSHKYHVSQRQVSRLWRIHFPDAEQEILSDRYCLKPLIKLMKGLRDEDRWPVPSYLIKTVAFHMVKEHSDPRYFDERYLGIRFIQMLQALQKHLERRHLGHIFYPSFNLFDRLREENLLHLENRFRKIINEIQRNPYSIKPLFRCSRYS